MARWMPVLRSLNVIPARRCICLICKISTVFLMPKSILINDVILFSALAEVKPSALLALASDLSAINASSLTVKAFLDIQDDNLPKLVVCQSLFSGAGLSFKQFAWFMRLSEEQISMDHDGANAHHLLYSAEDDAENNDASPQFSSLSLSDFCAVAAIAAAEGHFFLLLLTFL